jgi:predicted glutamine amidotransferase
VLDGKARPRNDDVNDMCRMLGILSNKPISPLLLSDFRSLAENGKVLKGSQPGHQDGWGIVCYNEGFPIYLGRQPNSAMSDEFVKACKQFSQRPSIGPVIAHLRKASSEYGERILENTAPFIRDKWSFAHNGTIHKFNVEVSGARGTTDSEKFFLLLLREMADGGSIENAIEKTVDQIRKSFRYTSMTFLLSNGNKIYAYREYSKPDDGDYYNLMYAVDKNTVIISQEKTWLRDWVVIPNGSLAKVQENLEVCIQHL